MSNTRTVRDLITRALRKARIVGAGETPDADDAADALLECNLMLEQWQADRLFAYAVIDRTAALAAGVGSYTVGSGGAINVPWPVRIEWAYTRDAQNYDRPISIVPAEVYQGIALKSYGNDFPGALYYRTSYPLGVIELSPLPVAGLTLHFGGWEVLSEFASMSTTVSLPPGYERAIVTSLAETLCSEYGKTVPDRLAKEAQMARALIQGNNLPDLRMSCEFMGGCQSMPSYDDVVAGNY